MSTNVKAIKRQVRKRILLRAVRKKKWVLIAAGLSGAMAGGVILLGPTSTYRLAESILLIQGHEVTIPSMVLEPERMGGLVVLPSLIYPLLAFVAPFIPAVLDALGLALEWPRPRDYRAVMNDVLDQALAREEIDEATFKAKSAKVRAWKRHNPTDQEIDSILA